MKKLLSQPIVSVAIINAGVALVAFLKDILLAAYTGTSLYADALTLSFFLPDSLGNNIMAAAISVACVPVFSRLAAKQQFNRLYASIRKVTFYFLSLTLFIMMIGYLFSSKIVAWLQGASGAEFSEVVLPLFRILLPTVSMFIIVAIGTAVLQTMYQFFIPAIAPLLANMILLGGTVYFLARRVPVSDGITGIAIVTTIGIAAMALWIGLGWYRSSSRKSFDETPRPLLSKHETSEDWKDIMGMFLPYVIILLSMQCIYLIERYLLASSHTGAIAALNYAFRLSQFPIWVFVAAVSVVILPSLSAHLALEQRKLAFAVMASAFRSVVLIVLPFMLFLYVLREPVTVALFQRGAFDDRSVLMTSGILEGYSLSILSQAISLVCIRYFLASRRLVGVLVIFIVCCIVTILLDIWLIQLMGSRGIGYGAAIGALLNALLLLYWFILDVRPNLNAVFANIPKYAAVLSPPTILLLFMRGGWSWMSLSGTFHAILFILFAGCLYILFYIFAIQKYWPVLWSSIISYKRKG